MNRHLLIKALCVALFTCRLSYATECSPVNIEIAPVRDGASSKYRSLVNDQREKGGRISPKRLLKWKFQEKSGEFLLAEVSRKGSKSCVLFLRRENEFLSLGGNDHCTWAADPKLVWRERKAWLEFPLDIKLQPELPAALNELTAHFNKATGDVCILGLPPIGFDTVRCPDDEAPDSE